MKIKIKIGDEEKELTPEQAKELWLGLSSIFGEKPVFPWPQNPAPYFPPSPTIAPGAPNFPPYPFTTWCKA